MPNLVISFLVKTDSVLGDLDTPATQPFHFELNDSHVMIILMQNNISIILDDLIQTQDTFQHQTILIPLNLIKLADMVCC